MLGFPSIKHAKICLRLDLDLSFNHVRSCTQVISSEYLDYLVPMISLSRVRRPMTSLVTLYEENMPTQVLKLYNMNVEISEERLLAARRLQAAIEQIDSQFTDASQEQLQNKRCHDPHGIDNHNYGCSAEASTNEGCCSQGGAPFSWVEFEMLRLEMRLAPNSFGVASVSLW